VHTETLDLLRCPYCGGRLALVSSLFNQVSGDYIEDGILGCHCCIFPVVSGIRLPAAGVDGRATRTGGPSISPPDHVRPRRRCAGGDLRGDGGAPGRTPYRELVERSEPNFEGGYFCIGSRIRPSSWLTPWCAVAGTALADGGRAVDTAAAPAT
jgi:hypothetical protein